MSKYILKRNGSRFVFEKTGTGVLEEKLVQSHNFFRIVTVEGTTFYRFRGLPCSTPRFTQSYWLRTPEQYRVKLAARCTKLRLEAWELQDSAKKLHAEADKLYTENLAIMSAQDLGD